MHTWSDLDVQSLIEQVKAGKTLTQTSIPGKTKLAIRHKRRFLTRSGALPSQILTENCLRYRKEHKWTNSENEIILRAVEQRIPLSKIVIPNRTTPAISAQRKTLANQGKCEFEGYENRAPWTRAELKILREFTIARSMGSNIIFRANVLPNRSCYAIADQMRRQDFAHPGRSKKAKDAKERRIYLTAEPKVDRMAA